jgi:hypothetical protein
MTYSTLQLCVKKPSTYQIHFLISLRNGGGGGCVGGNSESGEGRTIGTQYGTRHATVY